MSGKTPPNDAYRLSVSLQFGWKVWQCFSPDSPVLGINDIVERLKAGPSSVHRYLKALVVLGFLEQLKPHGKYQRTTVPVPLEAYPRALSFGSELSMSFVRGLWVLAYFEGEPAEAGITELASQTGMTPSMIHRYAITLVDLGCIEQNRRTRQYRRAGTVSASPETPSFADTDFSRTLAKGIAVLDCYSGDDSIELGLSELADGCSLTPSTVHRYVQTLTRLGLLRQERPLGKYRLDTEPIRPDMYHVFDGNPQYAMSVAKGLAVLSCFGDGPGLSGAEIVHLVGARSGSTVHRYITTWLVLGHLAWNPVSRKYRANPKPASPWDKYRREHLLAPDELSLAILAA